MDFVTETRPHSIESISGDVEIAPVDWTLLDPSGEPLARLYKVFGGPQNGQWYWTVLFMPDGSVGKGGTGFTVTGREAHSLMWASTCLAAKT